MSSTTVRSGSKIGRAAGRVLLKTARVVLAPIEAIHPRSYMMVYTALLVHFGLKLTGAPRYISSSAHFDDFRLITLGARVVISRNVIFLTHDYSLTTALVAIGEPPLSDVSVNRDIRIGMNVFVGMNAIILPGTIIGDNAIIAAGTVVRGSIPGDGIYAGNPAKRVSGIIDRAIEWKERRDGAFTAQDPRLKFDRIELVEHC